MPKADDIDIVTRLDDNVLLQGGVKPEEVIDCLLDAVNLAWRAHGNNARVNVLANFVGWLLQDYARLRSLSPCEGWKLVPVEPLPEMVAAWNRYKNGHHWPDEPPPKDTSDYGAYRAMISASPSPPVEDKV
jgi:hypothetical protein